MDQHEEIWLVQLGNGATRAMTLDELDSAFNDGVINEDTYVRRDGATKWVRLIDELNASEPAPSAAAPAPAPMAAYEAYSPTPAPVVYQQYNSVRPVVSEIDMDEMDFESPFAKKSGKGKFVVMGLVAAAAVAVAAFGATKLKGTPAVDVNASVVNAVQAPVAVTPPPPVDPQPVVQKPALNEDMKKALADKDNQFAQKQDAKKKARQNQYVPKRGKTQPPPFSKNGSAYDPLNAKL